jgi:hypothetical protein
MAALAPQGQAAADRPADEHGRGLATVEALTVGTGESDRHDGFVRPWAAVQTKGAADRGSR